jgi:hypothetical protein
MIGIIAAASLIASFDCQLAPPQAVGFENGKAKASDIGLPPASLNFSIALKSGNPPIAQVTWSGDPMQIAGEFPVISTAPGAYAFSSVSSAPCLFTEQACLSQVNLVEGGDGTTRIIVTPVAVAKNESGKRSPFAVIAEGQCTRTDTKK